MKTLYHLLTLVMGLILFVSCDKESEVLQNPEEKILKIQVTDKGYASDPANKETKAIDEEFNTTFENGEKIGVFIVDEDGSITYANVPVTLKDNVWVDETQGVRIKSTTARVFAYYPYVEDSKINDLVSPEAESESDFFAGYINSLDISDQSTLSRYRQADVLGCMVKKDSISEGTITFNMSHLMGLVVLDFSKVVCSSYDLYSLTTDPDYQWKRNIKTSSAIISELKIEDKTLNAESVSYKYLQKPGDNTFNGTFRANGEAKTFTIAFTNLQSGFYKSYHIKGNVADIVNNKTHSLKIGDIFKSDGGLISQEELASPGITEEEKAECVGIVFQTYYKGDGSTKELTGRIGSAEIEKLKEISHDSGYLPHGLVMALEETQKIQWSINNNLDEVGIDNFTDFDGYKQDISGLSHTGYIWDKLNISDYPLFVEAKNYNIICNIESVSTGWFVPSSGQLFDAVKNLGMITIDNYNSTSSPSYNAIYWNISGMCKKCVENINNKISIIEKSDLFIVNDNKWLVYVTSSENNGYPAHLSFNQGMDLIQFALDYRTANTTKSRFILAF